MSVSPYFYVIARLAGPQDSFKRWSEILINLCSASLNEKLATSYYWSRDLDGEPDTIWGLEGFSHPVGLFIDHMTSDIFRREMQMVADEKLLIEDPHVHYYDLFGGFLKRDDDTERDSKSGCVAIYHFWASKGRREEVLAMLVGFTDSCHESKVLIQSASVMRECRDIKLASLWLRLKSFSDLEKFKDLDLYQNVIAKDLKAGGELIEKVEVHHSTAFDGYLNKKVIEDDLSSGTSK